jgi:WD40 repeat protein
MLVYTAVSADVQEQWQVGDPVALCTVDDIIDAIKESQAASKGLSTPQSTEMEDRTESLISLFEDTRDQELRATPGAPRISPSGRYVAFEYWDTRRYLLFIFDRKGKPGQKLLPVHLGEKLPLTKLTHQLAWHPSGPDEKGREWFAFASQPSTRGERGYSVYLGYVENGQLLPRVEKEMLDEKSGLYGYYRLPAVGQLERPVWSADGKYLFTLERPGEGKAYIRVFEDPISLSIEKGFFLENKKWQNRYFPLKEGHESKLTPMQFDLSPDGNFMAIAYLGEAKSLIWLFDFSMWKKSDMSKEHISHRTWPLEPSSDLTRPSWSPDSKYLAVYENDRRAADSSSKFSVVVYPVNKEGKTTLDSRQLIEENAGKEKFRGAVWFPNSKGLILIPDESGKTTFIVGKDLQGAELFSTEREEGTLVMEENPLISGGLDVWSSSPDKQMVLFFIGYCADKLALFEQSITKK